MASFSAAFLRSRQIFREMASLRMEIRALTQELAATRDAAQRSSLGNRRSVLEWEWEIAMLEHRVAMQQGIAGVHGLAWRDEPPSR